MNGHRMTNDFDLPAIRKSLLKSRDQHGANTPAGRRCSNILEQLENLAKTTDRDQRANLERDIQTQMAELASLSSSGSKGDRV
jgi:hypothetical protein